MASRRSIRAWTSPWIVSSSAAGSSASAGRPIGSRAPARAAASCRTRTTRDSWARRSCAPNALTSAEGRSFFDRAFVIKLSGAYRAPGDVRVGIVARYQDGLPFSRMVLTDAFIQGRDLVMAIPRGAQRFTYMFTLDAKVEKDLTFGRRQVGADFRGLQPDQRHHRGRGVRRHRTGLPPGVGGAAAAGHARRPAAGLLRGRF